MISKIKKTVILSIQLSIICIALCPKEIIAKPIALTGHSYGKHEIKMITNKAIVISKNETYLYKKTGDSIPIEKLNDYSMLIVVTSVKPAMSNDDMSKLKSYVENGGTLMLIKSAPFAMSGGWKNLKKYFSWAGIDTLSYLKSGKEMKVNDPANPILKNVEFKDNVWPRKEHYAAIATPPMKIIAGSGNYCIIGEASIGKGKVIYLGPEIFRMTKSPELAKKYLEIIRNIIRQAKPSKQLEVREAMLKSQNHDDKQILLWDREWTRGEEYGPRFYPPLPKRKELISSLSTDMALDEYDSLQLNITPLKSFKLVEWKLSSKNFPLKNIEFFVQARPTPIPWPKNPAIAKEYPYWLIPPQYLNPKGKLSFESPAYGKTGIIWLRISSFNIKPGKYSASLSFCFDNKRNIEIPIAIKVYNVRIPRVRPITLGVGGHVYGDVNRPAPALRFARDLEAHGNEWSLLNAFRTYKLKTFDGITIRKYIKSDKFKQDLKDGQLPKIDFSSFDGWLEQAIGHGLIYFKAAGALRYLTYDIKNGNFTDKEITTAEHWFLKNSSNYFREKGIRVLIDSKGDELHREKIYSDWLPWAKKMHAAGWDCTSSFSFGNMDYAQLVKDISPYVKLWTLNQGLHQGFIANIASGKIKIREDAVIGTYGAGEGRGSEFRKPLSSSRYLGWEAWKSGFTNCMPNPYFKGWIYYYNYGNRGETGGIAGERWVSYIDKDNLDVPLADCPFWEGIREGLEEGNLAAILEWYLDTLQKAGINTDKTRKKLNNLVSDMPGATIKRVKTILRRYGMKIDYYKVKPSAKDYRKAKKEVLEMLSGLSSTVKQKIKPELSWNEIKLVKQGNPVTAIYGEGETLAATMKKLSEADIPVLSDNSLSDKYQVHIVIGSAAQNPLAAKLIEKYQINAPNNKYPGKNSYYIKELDIPAGKLLFIAGPDQLGTRKGVKMFSKFLKATGNWIE